MSAWERSQHFLLFFGLTSAGFLHLMSPHHYNLQTITKYAKFNRILLIFQGLQQLLGKLWIGKEHEL